MIRSLPILGWVGLAGSFVVAWLGWSVEGQGTDGTVAHLLAALVVTSCLLLCFLAAGIYAILVTRILVRVGAPGPVVESYRRVRARVLAWGLLGVAGSLSAFGTGLPTYWGRVEPAAHAVGFGVSVPLLVIALSGLGRALGRGEAAFRQAVREAEVRPRTGV